MRSSRHSHHARRPGTTVLELVVALVITGAVAAAGAAAFRQTIDRRTQLLTRSSDTERAAAMRSLLREWLGAATLMWPQRTSGVSFTTTAAIPGVSPGVPLRLYIDDDATTPEVGLTLEYLPSPEQPARRREIDAGISAMTVEYFDSDTRRWLLSDTPPSRRATGVRLAFPGQAGATADRLHELPLTIVFPTTGNSDPATIRGSAL
jgi:type II secretory pathway pseudopilin PulG